MSVSNFYTRQLYDISSDSGTYPSSAPLSRGSPLSVVIAGAIMLVLNGCDLYFLDLCITARWDRGVVVKLLRMQAKDAVEVGVGCGCGNTGRWARWDVSN